MQTQTADTIKIRDVVMPPERELRLWMRKHIATHNLPESALYLNVTGIYESSDGGGKWLHFKTQYSENWPGGTYAFTFKARPNTPWKIVSTYAQESAKEGFAYVGAPMAGVKHIKGEAWKKVTL